MRYRHNAVARVEQVIDHFRLMWIRLRQIGWKPQIEVLHEEFTKRF